MSDVSKALDEIMESVRENFASKNAAREEALPLCRESIRCSANAIRAVHRDDFEKARALVGQSGERVGAAKAALQSHMRLIRW